VQTFEKQPGQTVLAALIAMLLTPVLVVLLCVTAIGIAAVPFVDSGRTGTPGCQRRTTSFDRGARLDRDARPDADDQRGSRRRQSTPRHRAPPMCPMAKGVPLV
jgi:hypothetical protein